MPHRIEKIESTLQRSISEVLQRRLSDPRLEGFISITRVQVSPDLHNAIIYVSVMPESKEKQVLSGLQHAAKRIRSLVGKSLPTKTLPHLEFRLDQTMKTQARVFGAIQRAMDRSGPVPPESSEEEDESATGEAGPDENRDSPASDELAEREPIEHEPPESRPPASESEAHKPPGQEPPENTPPDSTR